ncbi:MAG TPA: response regulator, partial [Steroidobacteraceae bacterium]|nr:response regulator [Steroidobacteraceae bacterium]
VMMRPTGHLSLSSKLRLMIVSTAGAALVVASVLYVTSEVMNLRHDLAQHVLTLAESVADNVGALPGTDATLARTMLQSIQVDPDVRSVELFDAQGRSVSSIAFGAPGAPIGQLEPRAADAAAQDAPPVRFDGFTSVLIQVPVTAGGARGSHIQVIAELAQLYTQLKRYLELMALALSAAWLVAIYLANRLQRVICAPINELLEVAQNVRTSNRFTLRAQKLSDDEMGRLVDGFNGMLAEIERRDLSLRVYQNDLEKMVQERTVRLDGAVTEAREAVDRAEAANRAKSEFLARMSHEIRTPMNAVLGMAELLRISNALDERQRRYAVTIHQSGTALLGIINDILDFSKMEVGKLELEVVPFNIRDVVEDVIETLAERAHSKGLELMCDIPDPKGTAVLGDAKRLRQVLINLVGNAVKFTERGEVRVVVQFKPHDLLNPGISFEVIDTGIGIRAENCSTIFESFVQEDSSTTRQYGGTGLGLAISKQLVELMGGTIGVSSEPGTGSRFHFSVALTPDPNGSAEPQDTSVLRDMRLLLVDDNANNRRILRQQLCGWGARVTEAASGRQALGILDSAFGGQFDAFILDTRMPDHDGSEVLAAVRRRSEFANVPALMIGPVLASDAPQDTPDRHVAWLNKPVRQAQLHAALRSLVAHDLNATRRLQVISTAALAQIRQGKRKALTIPRLLLVEDNPVNQEVALAILQELGIRAVCAWDGEEALQRLAAGRFDVVLMDCHMPKLDGYATTRQLREMETLSGDARTAVIALTANALSGDAELCFAAGMDGYLSKPFSLDELYVTLKPYDHGAAADSATVEHAMPALVKAAPKAVRCAPAATGSPLDEQTLKQIRALRKPGGPDLLKKIVDLYLANSRTLIGALREALAGNDATGAQNAAHSLKSSSANVGAKLLADLCAKLETGAQEKDLGSCQAQFEQLLAEHERVVQALTAQTAAA